MVQKGQCLCGAIKLTIHEDQDKQIACHCTDCQRLAGGAYTTNVVVDDDKSEIEGETKSYRSKAASGKEVEHVFCPNCGSTIANRSPSYAGKTCFKTALFPAFKSIPFAAEIFVKDRFDALQPIEGAGQEQAMPSS
ncbi:hypothetical protein NliqN6_0179 [Naganishia liquefaciens]|uniref:CENP-V/GFA domain-containing protein n=1 Tax=Naganishia liquefaciens TaxID=104408 RepID=A0A8H3TME6_9TREE|nr:hypothetical protein NliqN6_0179 [Naganishia liquefaciens]